MRNFMIWCLHNVKIPILAIPTMDKHSGKARYGNKTK